MNKEDVFAHLKKQEQERRIKHKKDIEDHGECKPITDKEYKKTGVSIRCKSKTSFTSNKMWKDWNTTKKGETK